MLFFFKSDIFVRVRYVLWLSSKNFCHSGFSCMEYLVNDVLLLIFVFDCGILSLEVDCGILPVLDFFFCLYIFVRLLLTIMFDCDTLFVEKSVGQFRLVSDIPLVFLFY